MNDYIIYYWPVRIFRENIQVQILSKNSDRDKMDAIFHILFYFFFFRARIRVRTNRAQRP